jgi:uncharacterized protein
MSLIHRQTELSANIVAFGRYLRQKGFAIGPDREADALLALSKIPFNDQTQFYLALRAIFPQNKKQLNDFDSLYTTYWKEVAKAVDSKIKETITQKKKKTAIDQQTTFEALKNWLHGNKQNNEELSAYSLGENILKKDFGSYTDDDLAQSQQLIRELVRHIRRIVSRRYKASKQGQQLDLRKILSHNFRGTDEIINLFYRKQTQNKLRLVLLCDVSKSMDLYSRFFVQFMYAFQNLYQSIETFVFSTELRRITEDLKEMDYAQALENLSDNVPNWSGGTDLSLSFEQFVEKYAFRKLNSRTIVLIVSDGWDTGENTLDKSMAQIKRKARRIYWLNPLASSPDFKPEVKALQTAMPYLDAHLPAYSLDSLKQVLEKLR